MEISSIGLPIRLYTLSMISYTFTVSSSFLRNLYKSQLYPSNAQQITSPTLINPISSDIGLLESKKEHGDGAL